MGVRSDFYIGQTLKWLLGQQNRCGLALQITGQECYGRSGTFFDASQEGGVAESIRTEVLNLSKAPGDFWVL